MKEKASSPRITARALSIQALTEIRVPHPSERSAAESKNLLLDPLRKGWETTEAHLDRKHSARNRSGNAAEKTRPSGDSQRRRIQARRERLQSLRKEQSRHNHSPTINKCLNCLKWRRLPAASTSGYAATASFTYGSAGIGNLSKHLRPRRPLALKDVCCWRYIELESTSSASWALQRTPQADLLPPGRPGKAHSPQIRPTHNGLSISA